MCRSIAHIYPLARQVHAEVQPISQDGIRRDSSLHPRISFFIHAMGFLVRMKFKVAHYLKSHVLDK
jgi:hypothetical protein